MKASTVIVLAAASIASAQLSAIPSCALTCAISSLGSTGCAQTDISCICKASGFVSALQPCVEKACSPDDLQKTIAAAEGLCLQAGVTLTIATGGAPATTSAAADTSSAAVSTTTEAATTTTEAATTSTEAVTTSATVVIPTTVANTTMTTSVTAGTNGSTANPTTALPSASPTGNTATRNGVAVGGLAAVLAFAAALL